MSAIPVQVLETGQEFPSVSAAFRALTGARYNGNNWLLFNQGRPIAGVHLKPLDDPYWEPDLEWRRRQRPVRCTTTGTVYPSLSAAARSIGVHAYTLCRAIRRGKPCCDLTWEYADA